MFHAIQSFLTYKVGTEFVTDVYFLPVLEEIDRLFLYPHHSASNVRLLWSIKKQDVAFSNSFKCSLENCLLLHSQDVSCCSPHFPRCKRSPSFPLFWLNTQSILDCAPILLSWIKTDQQKIQQKLVTIRYTLLSQLFHCHCFF